MPFSHHSHSGQFCESHAKNELEEVVRTAVEKKMETFALTEHMPRDQDDFYPEEVAASQTTALLLEIFDAYYKEAKRLQGEYSSSIHILVGLETDWIRPSSQQLIESLLAKHQFDLFVGSVHHVHTVPIDYDQEMYSKARDISGGTDEKLFEDYFDAQLEMLKALKPPIVGHFDLIRLKSDDPDGSFQRWDGVWQKVLRNLYFIVDYGGLVELNSAALRKGMSEPYPKAEICKAFVAKGGRFTLSDDSHGVDQVGFGFDRVLRFVREVGIETMSFLELGNSTRDVRFPGVFIVDVPVAELQNHAFFVAVEASNVSRTSSKVSGTEGHEYQSKVL